ncbi:MAG: class I SAM-dependent methyltransferase, partial [Acidimicrobiia bacterium]
MRSPDLAVVAGGPAFAELADAEAARLGVARAEGAEEGVLALVLDEGGWALVDPAPGAAGPVRIDFARGPLGETLRRGGGRRDRLARALGTGRRGAPRVLDATGGMGRDTMLAAAL